MQAQLRPRADVPKGADPPCRRAGFAPLPTATGLPDATMLLHAVRWDPFALDVDRSGEGKHKGLSAGQ